MANKQLVSKTNGFGNFYNGGQVKRWWFGRMEVELWQQRNFDCRLVSLKLSTSELLLFPHSFHICSGRNMKNGNSCAFDMEKDCCPVIWTWQAVPINNLKKVCRLTEIRLWCPFNFHIEFLTRLLFSSISLAENWAPMYVAQAHVTTLQMQKNCISFEKFSSLVGTFN